MTNTSAAPTARPNVKMRIVSRYCMDSRLREAYETHCSGGRPKLSRPSDSVLGRLVGILLAERPLGGEARKRLLGAEQARAAAPCGNRTEAEFWQASIRKLSSITGLGR